MSGTSSDPTPLREFYFFSYFWTTIVFSPEDMARQLRDNGSFIPGLRPGPRTAEYLETVVEGLPLRREGYAKISVVYTSLHGTGIHAVPKVLAHAGLEKMNIVT